MKSASNCCGSSELSEDTRGLWRPFPTGRLRPIKNHRIIEWRGLKRSTMTIYFPPPCYVQGRQPLDQSALCHMQPGLECLQGWGIHNLQGQPVPVPHHPLGEKLPPNISPRPPLSHFKTIPACPITTPPRYTRTPTSLYAPFNY